MKNGITGLIIYKRGISDLVGGSGNDESTGGKGSDLFQCGTGTDKITDFYPSEGDKKTNDRGQFKTY